VTYNKLASANHYQKNIPVSKVLKTLHISRATLYEYLKREGVTYSGFKKGLKKK
jgi:predicted DNA-binding transcriptional regulator AlpA